LSQAIRPQDWAKAEKEFLRILDELLEKADRVDKNVSIYDAMEELITASKLPQVVEDQIRAFSADLYVTTRDKLSLRGMVSEVCL
jgi:hypothetical protein